MRSVLFEIYKRTRNCLAATPLRRIRRMKPLQNLLFRLLHPPYVEIEGRKMVLDEDDCMLLSVKGIYEPPTTAFVKENVRKGEVVIDIGANIGYYTILFAELVGAGGRVIAFEPHPANCGLLRRNVALNRLENVEVVERAVSDRNGTLPLYLQGGAMYHTLVAPGGPASSVEVDCVRLDDFLEGRKERAAWIKIDVEGAEGLALEGMRKTLESHRDIRLISEFSAEGLRAAGTDPMEYLRKLDALGFSVRVLDGTSRRVDPADFASLENAYFNLFFTREK